MTKREDGPSAAVRIRVYKRDRFQCTYCGVPGTETELEVDHIVAVANGGSHHMSNLTTACRKCNQEKGARPMQPGARKRADVRMVQKDRHPLVGMFLHTFKDGKIRWQGHILDVDGDVCLVQLFEWFMGEPTHVEKMSKAEIYSDSVKLYASREAWDAAATAHNEREYRRQCAELEANTRKPS